KLDIDGDKVASPGDSINLEFDISNSQKSSFPSGELNLEAPEEWKLDNDHFSVPELEPGENHQEKIVVEIPEDAEPGSYPIKTELRSGDAVQQLEYTVLLPSGMAINEQTHKIDGNLE